MMQIVHPAQLQELTFDVIEKVMEAPDEDMAGWLGESGLDPTPGEVAMSCGVVCIDPKSPQWVLGLAGFAKNLAFDAMEILMKMKEGKPIIFEDDKFFHELTVRGYRFYVATGYMAVCVFILKRLGVLREEE